MTIEQARKRWQKLPKVRREQALYDVRLRLEILRATGSKRDLGESVLLELLLLSAGFEVSDRSDTVPG